MQSTNVDLKYNQELINFREKNPEFNFIFDDIEMDEYMEKNWSHRKIYKIYKNSIFGASKAIFGDTAYFMKMVVFI